MVPSRVPQVREELIVVVVESLLASTTVCHGDDARASALPDNDGALLPCALSSARRQSTDCSWPRQASSVHAHADFVWRLEEPGAIPFRAWQIGPGEDPVRRQPAGENDRRR
ncbi:hypothetical protein SEVIR_9G529100v4 [Setaria viridis]|uniref:Uncharacterized protein n=1 Tax=Setaria viridis TaxID=4556 RepID=A0A4U6T9M0_SETVI|nr:hypothetical protein SEVIR_9G529100v2 [Setaria viridis]